MKRIVALISAVLLIALASPGMRAQTEPPAAPPAPSALDEAKEAFRANDYPRALAAATRHIEKEPQSAAANYIAGVCQVRLGNFEEGERLLTVVEGIAPKMSNLQYQLGYLHFMKGQNTVDAEQARAQYRQAAEHFANELEKNPAQPASLASRAAALFRAGEYDESLKAHEAWIAAVAQDNAPVVSLGNVYAKTGKIPEALDLLARLPQSDPKSVAAAAFQIAQSFYADKRYDGAQTLARKAIEADPQMVGAHGLLVASLAEAGRMEESAVALPVYLALNPPTSEVEQVGQVFEQRFRAALAQTPPAGTVWPEARKLAEPRYPKQARTSNMATKVSVVAQIRKDGTLGDAYLVPNRILAELRSMGFEEAALDALRRSRFEPGQVNGQPADLHVLVTLQFVP